MTLRAGIVGCGGIARAHARGYSTNGIAVTAVADTDPAAAQRLAEEISGRRQSPPDVYPTCIDLLESKKVDVVSICSPPAFHEEAAVPALTRGIHVLCEKPLAHTVDSARRITDACKDACNDRAILMTAFRHRFLPSTTVMKELVSSGDIGDVVLFQNSFCAPAFAMREKWFSKKAVAGGGALMDTSIHSVDLFRYLFGEVGEQHAVMHRHLDGTDVEDAGMVILKSVTGVIGCLTASWVTGTQLLDINIMGQRGRVYFDYAAPETVRTERYRTSMSASSSEEHPIPASNGFSEEIAHFVQAIEGTADLMCSAHDGLRALEIIQSVYASISPSRQRTIPIW